MISISFKNYVVSGSPFFSVLFRGIIVTLFDMVDIGCADYYPLCQLLVHKKYDVVFTHITCMLITYWLPTTSTLTRKCSTRSYFRHRWRRNLALYIFCIHISECIFQYHSRICLAQPYLLVEILLDFALIDVEVVVLVAIHDVV